jgi:type I restriction enzyme R subunit
MPILTPEQKAREMIDDLLDAAGWSVQSRDQANLSASRGVAVAEFPLETGFADYMLFVDKRPIGVIEAKSVGSTLSSVETQTVKYSDGLSHPLRANAWCSPLPFLYQSTGVETFFTDERDPNPRSRRVFAFHRPETLVQWAQSGAARQTSPALRVGERSQSYGEQAPTLRTRLRHMPPLNTEGLWKAQIEAVRHLERSLARDRPRSLVQMATGSGKTYMAVTTIYRLIKYAKARRVLFMVDRTNLGRQAHNEFNQYVTPDDGRKFTELYNVQHLQSNALDRVSKVCITTVQRLYSMLRGEQDFDAALEDRPLGKMMDVLGDQVRQAAYSDYLPIEYFDFIFIDECHRSIYNVWRQVLEYFDAYLIGLTATPSKQTLGFFNGNLVMEYPRERAVADGVNVDGWVYRIRTQITEHGSRVEAGEWVGKRDRKTRAERWEQLGEDLDYEAAQLDRDVVAPDQIRTVIRTFRDRLFTDIFPDREEVPKTLIFAKDDNHAEEIVRIVREEFGKENDFCQKITYKTTGKTPEDLIAEFRNSYFPRIAVSVDMIATGTDVKPIEILLFMRRVQSAPYFEQMVGRGTRVITETDLQGVTPDARRKTHFVIVDAVGVVEHPKIEVGTMDRKRSVAFDRLLEKVAFRMADEDDLSSLAVRLSRLESELTDDERQAITQASGGKTPRAMAHVLLDALDPDQARARARALAGDRPPTAKQIEAARGELVEEAIAPFDDPDLRDLLINVKRRTEQTLDVVSQDCVIETGYSAEDTQRARQMVESFRAFLEQNRDEIAALQILFNQPYARGRLTFEQIKELAQRIQQPPHAWTTEALWRAYAQLERDKVRGVGARRVLTDLVSLVRHAVQLDDELVPYPDRVRQRYEDWLAAQEAEGRTFTVEQRWWLDRIAETIGVNLGVRAEDFGYGELFNRGGWHAARELFGEGFPQLLEDLNETLVV